MGFPMDDTLEDKVSSTMQSIVDIAVELGTSLALVERNTREIFWWTTWAITVVLGLFIVHLLVKVSAQLGRLNTYQGLFHRMWVEDKANDEKDRRERQERYNMLAMRRAATPQEGMGLRAAAAQAQTRLGSYLSELDDLSDSDDSIPEEGTPEYEELLNDLREEIRRRKEENQGEGVPQE